MNVIDIELAAGRDVKLQTGLNVGCLRHHFRTPGVSEIALCLNDEERCRSADSILLLFGIQRLFLKNAAFHGGGILGARLLDSDVRVLHINVDLVDQPLHTQLALPQIDSGGGVICLRVAVAEGNA